MRKRSLSPLRICGLIDGLAPGGAQRQFVELMTGLADRGHHVSVIVYHNLLFFRPQLLSKGIAVLVVNSSTRLGRIFAVNAAIRPLQPDVVVSFLDVPNGIAEFCNILSFFRWRVIASERIYNPDESGVRLVLRMLLHRFASHVVSNSYSQRDYLIRKFPRLARKISSIHNCVDLAHFSPVQVEMVSATMEPILLVVVASYIGRKNPIRFADAFARLLAANPGRDIRCNWYGDKFTKSGEPYPFYVKLAEKLVALGISDRFELHQATENIQLAYQNSSALCLPSLAEGCANVICEAMACGLPILASRVGDNAFVAEDGKLGFSFDPESVESIYGALQKFCDLSLPERASFQANSRKAAEVLFGRDQFLDKWEWVIRTS